LPPDVEICDECAGKRLDKLYNGAAMLCGWADTRPVAFKLQTDRPLSIGRSVPGGEPPDIDLRRFSGAGSVHRRHAQIELRGRDWCVTHLGTNPLVIRAPDRVALESGASATLRGGDMLEIGGVQLVLVVGELSKRI
jgi:hypothetical protein